MNTAIFWRISPANIKQVQHGSATSEEAPPELLAKVKPRHGIVIADWDTTQLVGHVKSLAVVKSVAPSLGTAEIERREVEITLRPNPSGRIYWSGRTFFKFAKDVALRYMLADLFAEQFPDFDSLEFVGGSASAERAAYSSVPIPGYVYVIRSQYGFKIGKTVNLRARTRLFEVRLPFPITVEHYAWFEDYTQAERMFHEMFFYKRLEGEWFDLSPSDLKQIGTFGKKVPIAGLG